jgi:hypothetical protein
MGRTNTVLLPFYKKHIKAIDRTALLGFTNNNWFNGDLYDLQLGNWNINSDWHFDKKYDTIISLRCPYFAKNPKDFVDRCMQATNPGAKLYLDWGLGDHWRFEKYKVGWVKDNEHEWAYSEDNFLWSTYWDRTLLSHDEVKKFEYFIGLKGYSNLSAAIHQEVPSIFSLKDSDLDYRVYTKFFWENSPQLYILLEINK